MDIKQKRLRSHDFEANAAEALAVARDMSPGPEGIQALKVAGQLRSAADVHGVIFAKRGRPRRG
jgi:hypothetical protein